MPSPDKILDDHLGSPSSILLRLDSTPKKTPSTAQAPESAFHFLLACHDMHDAIYLPAAEAAFLVCAH